jgi:hypothetical protein
VIAFDKPLKPVKSFDLKRKPIAFGKSISANDCANRTTLMESAHDRNTVFREELVVDPALTHAPTHASCSSGESLAG